MASKELEALRKRLDETNICYCPYCRKDTKHFPTMSLRLPACHICLGLADWITGIGSINPDNDKIINNAMLEWRARREDLN